MSLESFIRLYQELLTMVDPNDELSVASAQTVLKMVCAMAHKSGMAHAVTIRCMMSGERSFASLARHREDFAGKPGDYQGNSARRQRLKDMLYPSC